MSAKRVKSSIKLSEAIEGFLLDKQLVISPNTVTTYSYYFRDFIKYLNDPRIGDITPNDIKRYLVWVVEGRGLSKRTASDRYTAISSLYTWAERELEIENVIRRVPKPKFTRRVVEPFSPDEVSQLLSRLDKQPLRFQVMLLILLDSGIRVSELCNLEVRDYVQVSGRLFIRSGKGDKDRIVFVGRQTRRVIWRYITERNIESINEPLLATNNLTPMRRDNVRRDLTKYAKEFGIKAYPHKFRHTFAVNFLRHGGNVRQLQAILGHEKLDMTMRYTKLAEIDLEAAKAFSPVDNAKKK